MSCTTSECRMEEARRELLTARAHLRDHGGQLVRPRDIPWYRPIDWLASEEPEAIRREQHLKKELEDLGFSQHPFPITSSLFKHSLGKYVELLAHAAKDGIDEAEGETLFTLAIHAENPEIRLLFGALVNHGSFVTRHANNDLSTDRDLTMLAGRNLCLNFDHEPKKLLCHEPSSMSVQYSAAETEVPVPPTHIGFSSEELRLKYKAKWDDHAFQFKGLTVPQTLELLADHLANPELVSRAIAWAFHEVLLPETGLVIAHAILNIISLSTEIDQPTKQSYGSLVEKAIGKLGERFLTEVEAVGIAPPPNTFFEDPESNKVGLFVEEPLAVKGFREKITADLELAMTVHGQHSARTQDRFQDENRMFYHLQLSHEREALHAMHRQYRSWLFLRVRILDPQYLTAVNQAMEAQSKSFRFVARSTSEYFWETMTSNPGEGFLGGAVGLLAGNYFSEGIKGWWRYLPYLPPVVGGLIVDASLAAHGMHGALMPTPLFLPELTAVPAGIKDDKLP